VEVTISTAILLIATIIMATVFTGAALSQLYTFQNSLKEISQENQQAFGTNLVIIGEAQESSPSSILVWVKNVGQTSFSLDGTNSWDVFLTFPNQSYIRFSYNTAQSDCWNAQLLNPSTPGIWQQGETVLITVYIPSGQITSGSYSVRLTMPTGVSVQDQFSF